MKYSVLICGQRKPQLVHSLSSTFCHWNLLPDFLYCETVGSGTLQIRMVLECEEAGINALVPLWKMTAGVQSVVFTRKAEGEITTP